MLSPKALKTFIVCLMMLYIASIGLVYAQKQPGASEGLTKKARDHLNLFQYEQALQLLKQAMELEPDNWEPWFLAGRSFMKLKKEAEAEKYLVKAIQLNASELELQKTLGALYIGFAKNAQNKGQTAEMTEYLHKACRAYPAGTKIWQSLMEQWWNAGEYEKIKNEGDLIIKSNATAFEQGEDKSLQAAMVIIAKAYYREGDFGSTGKYLDHAGKIRVHNEEMYAIKRELKNKAEENVKKLVDQAKELSNKGEFDKALALLQTANKVPGARSGEILELMDRVEKDASLKKTIKEVDALLAARSFEEALEKLQEASFQFPEQPEISTRLASTSATVEKIRDEEARLNAAAATEKRKKQELARQFSLLVSDGENNEQNKNYDLALINYEKALKLSPGDKNLPQTIARVKELAEKARERQNAFSIKFNEFESSFSGENYEECYSQGKELRNDFPEHEKALAAVFSEVCLKLGKPDEAKEAALKLEGATEHETLYHYVLGMSAYQQGNRDLALEHLGKVKEKNSSFRPGINTTIFLIYLYKMQLGIYILLIGLAFPAYKSGREALANWKAARKIRRIEKIKETGDYEANLDFLEERFAREDVPNLKQVQVLLAEALLRKGSAQRAYEMANNLLKKDARNPLAKRIAGEAALQIEDTSPQGLEHIQGLLKIDETRKDVVAFLARVFMKQQADHKMAQDFILKAISLNPADSESVVYLADIYIKRQTYSQQTYKIFERAIKIAPEVPEYYIAIIENLHRIDNHPEAEKWRETAAARFPAQEEFMADRPRPGAVRSGLKLKSESESSLQQNQVQPTAPGAFPDYDSIGNDDYNADDHIAGSTLPDYQQPAPVPQPSGFPDYDSIGEDSDETLLPPLKPPQAAPPAPSEPVVSGPQKTCPHCNSVIPLKEYYCSKCGKPC
ncbi:MAG: tetratricopeptide repeat protein [Candidatus Riflebacteria bacterium]|nr:tetratricopeptide repeat protein [Candidatus Riflebacteria bacterium]